MKRDSWQLLRKTTVDGSELKEAGILEINNENVTKIIEVPATETLPEIVIPT